ncbi:MAG: VOC family protein [Candidatus Riflemargulisbacteria bacterium]
MNINFFTINLLDITESLFFYRDTLGLKVVRDFCPTDFMRIVFLQGEGTGQIELIENKIMKQGVQGNYNVSIGIKVLDISSVFQKMQDKGVTITRNMLNMPHGPKMFFIKDPNGIEVEFIQE